MLLHVTTDYYILLKVTTSDYRLNSFCELFFNHRTGVAPSENTLINVLKNASVGISHFVDSDGVAKCLQCFAVRIFFFL